MTTISAMGNVEAGVRYAVEFQYVTFDEHETRRHCFEFDSVEHAAELVKFITDKFQESKSDEALNILIGERGYIDYITGTFTVIRAKNTEINKAAAQLPKDHIAAWAAPELARRAPKAGA